MEIPVLKSAFTFVAPTLLGLVFFQATTAQTLMAAEDSAVMRSPTTSSELYRSCMSGSSSLRPECYEPAAHLMVELSGMGSRGDLIARTRQQTLQILNSDN